jgi:hypothetical protein
MMEKIINTPTEDFPREKKFMIVGSPDVVRTMAHSFLRKGQLYEIVRVSFNNFNRYWNGKRGIGLRVSISVYNSLF